MLLIFRKCLPQMWCFKIGNIGTICFFPMVTGCAWLLSACPRSGRAQLGARHGGAPGLLVCAGRVPTRQGGSLFERLPAYLLFLSFNFYNNSY